MIVSMTGYGKSEVHNDEIILSVELHTVNSRFLDFSPRLPKALAPYESEAIKSIKEKCIRGRVTLSAKLDYLPGSKSEMVLNKTKLEDYLQIIKDIQKTAKQVEMLNIGDILRLPDIFTSNGSDDENVELKTLFMNALENALEETEKIRIQEGNNIQIDLRHRLDIIEKAMQNIQTLAEYGKEKYFERYLKKIKSLMEKVDIDENRIYQEAAIVIEKNDITEEIIRFNSHMELFNKYMVSDNFEGKKLNFLLQEMGREVNTIGSKTDLVKISHLVVDIKDEMEKIREQVQNII